MSLNYVKLSDSSRKNTLALIYIFAIIDFILKIYLVLRHWLDFPYDNFFQYADLLYHEVYARHTELYNTINRGLAYSALIILSIECLLQLVIRLKIAKTQNKNKFYFFFLKYNTFIFPLLHGLFPEVFFERNKIDLLSDKNIFITIYNYKVNSLYLFIINLGIYLLIEIFCCRNKKIENFMQTRTTNWERILSILKHLFRFIFIIPFIILGFSAYVYNMVYMKDVFLKILFFVEFFVNVLFGFFMSLHY